MAQRLHPTSDALARIARLLRILALVTGRRAHATLTRAQLAQSCDCDTRTIQRDLDLLRMQVPLDYDAGLRAWVLPEKGRDIALAAPLTIEDALSLALLQGLVGSRGLPVSLLAALEKATATLSSPLRAIAAEAAAMVSRDGASADLPRDYHAAPLLPLLSAAAARRTVFIDYESRSSSNSSANGNGDNGPKNLRPQRTMRRVDPYAVESRRGVYWEMHAWCHKRQAIRTFALDRVFAVIDIPEIREPFVRRDEEWKAFQKEQGMGGLRGGDTFAVEVLFAPEVASYAHDYRWPPGLITDALPGGSVRLHGLLAGGMDGMVTELLRWRRHADVRGGPELRTRMAEEVDAMAALYKSPENVPLE